MVFHCCRSPCCEYRKVYQKPMWLFIHSYTAVLNITFFALTCVYESSGPLERDSLWENHKTREKCFKKTNRNTAKIKKNKVDCWVFSLSRSYL